MNRSVRILVAVLLSTSNAAVARADPADESALYFYKAVVTDVYDGDTITANVDLGFYTWLHEQKFRLAGIDAPEVKGASKEQGLKCRDMLAQRIARKEVLIQSIQDKSGNDQKEKYGRYLAVIWLDKTNVNDWLVAEGCAVKKDYK